MTNREKCLENLKLIINEFNHLYDKVKYQVKINENDFKDANKSLGEIMLILKELEYDGFGEKEFTQPKQKIGTRFNTFDELESAIIRTEVRDALRKNDNIK
jgi:hypothetical protein